MSRNSRPPPSPPRVNDLSKDVLFLPTSRSSQPRRRKAPQEQATATEGERAQRHILFLQGPASPFFSQLGAALQARGHLVDKINLNLGDRLFWRGKSRAYRGRFSRWQAYLEKRFEREAKIGRAHV